MYAALETDPKSLDCSESAWKLQFLLIAWKIQLYRGFPSKSKRETSLIISNLKTVLQQEKAFAFFFSFFIIGGGGPG